MTAIIWSDADRAAKLATSPAQERAIAAALTAAREEGRTDERARIVEILNAWWSSDMHATDLRLMDVLDAIGAGS